MENMKIKITNFTENKIDKKPQFVGTVKELKDKRCPASWLLDLIRKLHDSNETQTEYEVCGHGAIIQKIKE